ncbi:ankyrin repeat-containing domain protein, partial [Pelagophyceae sp. CCMP2097]
MHDAPSGKRPARLLAGAAGAKPSRRQKKRGEIVSLAPEADEVREALVKREGKSVVKKDKAWFKAWFKQERAGQAEEDVTALALQAADKSDDSSDSGVGSEDDDSDASDEEDRVARLPAEARLAAETPRPQVAAIVEALLKHGADLEALEKLGRTPLLCAVARRDDALVHLLLSRGADTSASQFSGQTALSLSARLGDVGILRQLLTAGASLLMARGVDVHSTDSQGRTALHYAAKFDRADAIAVLVDVGDADVSAADFGGATPLHVAALAGSPKALMALLARGALAKAVDQDGNQAVHLACRGGDVAAVETLVAYEAPLGCRNWAGLTPIGVAR